MTNEERTFVADVLVSWAAMSRMQATDFMSNTPASARSQIAQAELAQSLASVIRPSQDVYR